MSWSALAQSLANCLTLWESVHGNRGILADQVMREATVNVVQTAFPWRRFVSSFRLKKSSCVRDSTRSALWNSRRSRSLSR